MPGRFVLQLGLIAPVIACLAACNAATHPETESGIEFVGSDTEKTKGLGVLTSMFHDANATACFVVSIRNINGEKRSYLVLDSERQACKDLTKKRPSAELLATIANLNRYHVTLGIVEEGTIVAGDHSPAVRVGRWPPLSPGASGLMRGSLGIRILNPDSDYGSVPASIMSRGLPGRSNSSFVVAHEIGHVYALLTKQFQKTPGNPFNTDLVALQTENLARELDDPVGQRRLFHDPVVREPSNSTPR